MFFSAFGRISPQSTRRAIGFRDHVVPPLALMSVGLFLAWPLANPQLDPAQAYIQAADPREVTEEFAVTGEAGQIIRDGEWSVSRSAVMTAPAVGQPDPDTAQAIAFDLLQQQGMADQEYRCLHALWSRESNWNHFAQNPSSGAYGIPQALPAEKMASAGDDWATNPATQIRWGLGYIEARYGTPCAAWEHSELRNWY